ncbi:MAG: hypothetical protein ACKVVP_07130, partial [Chloroflexota bacterium]
MLAEPLSRPTRWDLRLDSSSRWLLLAAVLVGLAVRTPGVFWGSNFPPGWSGHHPDEYTHLIYAEMLIAPNQTPRWQPLPYP